MTDKQAYIALCVLGVSWLALVFGFIAPLVMSMTP